ncbi:hypothetical protein H6802_02745 [Candidatus Nomurabacteria bacterium]|nr:hypothetical protein [Candidatus Nomurabacteria bacterium]MCB9827167.1 hypothetical protein [Candidatus Nomurabacteria bacterium]MCB9827792.1 hypothetical protein [Candidatus Nomurabacteria bacterium]
MRGYLQPTECPIVNLQEIEGEIKGTRLGRALCSPSIASAFEGVRVLENFDGCGFVARTDGYFDAMRENGPQRYLELQIMYEEHGAIQATLVKNGIRGTRAAMRITEHATDQGQAGIAPFLIEYEARAKRRKELSWSGFFGGDLVYPILTFVDEQRTPFGMRQLLTNLSPTPTGLSTDTKSIDIRQEILDYLTLILRLSTLRIRERAGPYYTSQGLDHLAAALAASFLLPRATLIEIEAVGGIHAVRANFCGDLSSITKGEVVVTMYCRPTKIHPYSRLPNYNSPYLAETLLSYTRDPGQKDMVAKETFAVLTGPDKHSVYEVGAVAGSPLNRQHLKGLAQALTENGFVPRNLTNGVSTTQARAKISR